MQLNRKDKEVLFKSGIPLEVAVNKILAKYGFWVNPEFSYLRNDKEFSIDTEAKYINNKLRHKHFSSLWLQTLVECKYTGNLKNRWVFFTYGRQVKSISRNEVMVFPFQKQNRNIRPMFLKDKKVSMFLRKIPVVWKGIAFNENEANTSLIKGAVSQLQFSYIHFLCEIVDFNVPYSFVKDREYIILPLIVTNNPLYISNSNFNLKKITHLQKVDVRKAKWLISDAGHSNELLEYNRNQFNDKYSSIIKKKEELYTDTNSGKAVTSIDEFKEDVKKFEEKNMPNLLSKLSEPRYVWIVNSNHFDEFLKNFLESLGVNLSSKRN